MTAEQNEHQIERVSDRIDSSLECSEPAAPTAWVDQSLSCAQQNMRRMEETAMGYLGSLSIGEVMPPRASKSGRCFLRWVEKIRGFPDGLTRAEVGNGMNSWSFDGAKLAFWIRRRPPGLARRQHWGFDIESATWAKLEEEVITVNVTLTKKGLPKCPTCGCSMFLTPERLRCDKGRLRCNNNKCGRELLYAGFY